MDDLSILDSEEVAEWFEASCLDSVDDVLHTTTRGQISHCPAGFLLALEVTLCKISVKKSIYNYGLGLF